LVDVGGEYDPSLNRFDHHQRTFNTTFPSHATKLSSAGLVWMHFGRPIVSQRTSMPEVSPECELIYKKLYDDFVEAIDANDNGIPVYDPSVEPKPSKRFSDFGVTLASMVSDLNHDFSPDDAHPPEQAPEHPEKAGAEKVDGSPQAVQAAEDMRFAQASTLMGHTFLRKLNHAHANWLPARALVQQAYETRHQVDPSGKIVMLPGAGIPWKEHLYSFEKEADSEKVLYVLYAEGPGESSKWRVQCVGVSKDSFASRKPLREEWRGVRDQELSGKTGIPGCVFVHASGFIGGNETKEGALEMARRSMVD